MLIIYGIIQNAILLKIMIIKDFNNLIKRSLSIRERSPAIKRVEDISQNDFYVIQCASNGFCLRQELKCFKLQQKDHVQVIGGELNEHQPNILSYLWFIKYSHKQNAFNIIHARTDLNLSADNYQCEIQHGSLSSTQYFVIEELKSGPQKRFRIRDHNENFLTLDGILQSNQFLERDFTQQFILKKKHQMEVQALKGTGFIITKDKDNKNRAIDLTNASRMSQNQIILYEHNFRMNQRWHFQGIQPEKQENYIRQSIDRTRAGGNRLKVYIRSALTEQFMSYNREHHQLMQSSYPEQWRLEPVFSQKSQQNAGQFHIQHVRQHKYLSFKEQTYELRLSSQPRVWIIPNYQWALSYAYLKETRLTHMHSI